MSRSYSHQDRNGADLIQFLQDKEWDTAARGLCWFALEHMKRNGGSYEAALAVAYRLNPEWKRAYTRTKKERSHD